MTDSREAIPAALGLMNMLLRVAFFLFMVAPQIRAISLKDLYENYSTKYPESDLMPHWRTIGQTSTRFMIHVSLGIALDEKNSLPDRMVQLNFIANILQGEIEDISQKSSYIIRSVELIVFRDLIGHKTRELQQLLEEPPAPLPDETRRVPRSRTGDDYDLMDDVVRPVQE